MGSAPRTGSRSTRSGRARACPRRACSRLLNVLQPASLARVGGELHHGRDRGRDGASRRSGDSVLDQQPRGAGELDRAGRGRRRERDGDAAVSPRRRPARGARAPGRATGDDLPARGPGGEWGASSRILPPWGGSGGGRAGDRTAGRECTRGGEEVGETIVRRPANPMYGLRRMVWCNRSISHSRRNYRHHSTHPGESSTRSSRATRR